MSRSIATWFRDYPAAAALLVTLLAALILLPGHAAADEPAEDTPPVISNGVITPGILSNEGGEVSVGADVVDDVGVTSVYAEVIGGDVGFFGVEMTGTGGNSYSGHFTIPPNWQEWDVNYSVYVGANDTNGTLTQELIGDIQVPGVPPFDEAPYVWEPSVTPRLLPYSGGQVKIEANASDTRALSEVYATIVLPGGGTAYLPLEPVSFTHFEGTFEVPANTGFTPEQYSVGITALDDIGQPGTADAGTFVTSKAFDQPDCSGVRASGVGSPALGATHRLSWPQRFSADACPGTKAEIRFVGHGADGFMGAGSSPNFIATESAPNAEEIATIKAGGTAGLLTIPVAQTAIAIVANPPPGCPVTKITNRQLERVFRGQIERWSQLLTAKFPKCYAPITRVVPGAGTGITTQFKRYLARMNGAALPCLGKTWKELTAIEGGKAGSPNTQWPEGCVPTPVVRPISAHGVGNTVNREKGSIGFAALPQAMEEHAAVILELENDGQLSPETEGTAASASYAAPTDGTAANCSTSYRVPIGGRPRGGEPGVDVDWSQVNGARPAIGGTAYPLCTLSYVLAFDNYKARGLGDPKRVTTLLSYIKWYILTPTGQAVLKENYAAPLPSTADASHDVFDAAHWAAGRISY